MCFQIEKRKRKQINWKQNIEENHSLHICTQYLCCLCVYLSNKPNLKSMFVCLRMDISMVDQFAYTHIGKEIKKNRKIRKLNFFTQYLLLIDDDNMKLCLRRKYFHKEFF